MLSLLFSSAVYADFSITTENSAETACIGSTTVIVDKITGDSGKYTAEKSGSAAEFTTTVPTEFSLKTSQNVYSYITLSSKIKPGAYDLITKVKSGEAAKEQKHEITAKDCHGTVLTADGAKNACPCDKLKYKLTLENNGQFYEKFSISLEGTAKEWANLSASKIELNANESKTFYAYMDAPCDVHGPYNLKVKALAEASLAGASTDIKIEILPCYEYDLEMKKSYEICENEELKIPLILINKGTADNTFSINLKGEKWAELEEDSLEAESGKNKTTEINVHPPFKTEGNFTLKVETMTSAGNVEKSISTNVKVKRCYGVDVISETKEDKLCKEERSYNLTVKNLGKFKAKYDLKAYGADWADLKDSTVRLEAGENKTIELIITPKKAEYKKYTINITATDSESGEKDTDKLKLELPKPEDCYKAEFTTKDEKKTVAIENPTTIFLLLKNKGFDEGTYEISMNGKGAKFSLINPEETTLQPDGSETIYLYVSPPLFTEEKSYNITVMAEEKNSKVIAKKEITIEVLKEELNKTEDKTEVEEKKIKPNIFTNIINSIIGFFKKLFMVQPAKNETLDTEEKELKIDTKEGSAIDTEEETNESVELNANETEINETDATAAKSAESINETDTNETIVNETKTNETIANETISPEAKEDLNATESDKEEKEAAEDEEDNETESAEEENKTIEAEETEDKEITGKAVDNETEKSIENLENFNEKLDDFWTNNKTYVIGAGAIALLIIIIMSGLGKKIIGFFEEEEPKNNK